MDRVKQADREAWKIFTNTFSKYVCTYWGVLSRKFTEKRAAVNVQYYRRNDITSPGKSGLWILQLDVTTDLSESGFIKAIRREIRFQ